MTILDDGALSNSTAWLAYYRDGEDVGVGGLFARLTLFLSYSDDGERRGAKRKVSTLFWRCSTNIYQCLPLFHPRHFHSEISTPLLSTSITGYKFVSVRLARAITNVHNGKREKGGVDDEG